MDHINKKNVEKVKKVFKENFLRELSDQESQEFLENMLLYTKRELSKAPGFTEEKFNQYLSGEVEILFSPGAINKEVLRVINSIGIESLEASSKYKRMSEMTDAMCLVLALKKLYGEEWMIKSQDNPDILIVKRDTNAVGNTQFYAVALEIMQIPEKEKQKFGRNIEQGVAEFIRDKKFKKRYQKKTHLLVHFNFDYMHFDLKKVSEILQSFPNNPYDQIWTRLNADPTLKLLNVSMLYPKLARIDIDVEKEYLDLMF